MNSSAALKSELRHGNCFSHTGVTINYQRKQVTVIVDDVFTDYLSTDLL